jgi:hypothetical protein
MLVMDDSSLADNFEDAAFSLGRMAKKARTSKGNRPGAKPHLDQVLRAFCGCQPAPKSRGLTILSSKVASPLRDLNRWAPVCMCKQTRQRYNSDDPCETCWIDITHANK